MQTFLPYPDFIKSAACLDNRRLGKQRVEALQILRTLFGVTQGWRNHPAVKMWKGHELALEAYANACCDEWICRGFKDTCCDKVLELLSGRTLVVAPPLWFGNRRFHRAHRSNLLRKDPTWYGKFNWNVPNDLPYVWPTN